MRDGKDGDSAMISIRKHVNRFVSAVTASVFLLSVPTAAFAQTVDTDSAKDPALSRLVELNPGSTYEGMLASAQRYAHETGKPLHTVAKEALAEAEAHAKQEAAETTATPRLLAAGKTPSIGKALHQGDIFFTPASTSGIAHGHVGIYLDTSTIEEAIPSTGVHKTSYAAISAPSGARKFSVKTTQAKRNRATTKAKSFIGRGYNIIGFAFNKTANGPMNCSQLVWVSYKDGSGIDLDSNGGTGVYPTDIRDSKLVSTYKRF